MLWEITGRTAGKIYEYLKEKNCASKSALLRNVEGNRDEKLMALGWLLREDKLTFTKENNGRTWAIRLK
jgi:hypothetical protein